VTAHVITTTEVLNVTSSNSDQAPSMVLKVGKATVRVTGELQKYLIVRDAPRFGVVAFSSRNGGRNALRVRTISHDNYGPY